jgi:hypothetical protein
MKPFPLFEGKYLIETLQYQKLFDINIFIFNFKGLNSDEV